MPALFVSPCSQCHFMTLLWFRALAWYEYAMRVDEDVCIQRFAHNPFDAMRDRGLVYGYGLLTTERHQETRNTMPSWVKNYTEALKIRPSGALKSGVDMYFTNFFVSRLDWWFRYDVQRFLRAIDASGNIYLHRWGDAPIQTSALTLFAPADRLVVDRLPTDYLHASTMNRVFSDGSEVDGWHDSEMQQHPLVRAHRRGRSLTNATGDVSTAYYVLLAFQTNASSHSIDETTQTCIAGIFAAYFGVGSQDVQVDPQQADSGTNVTVTAVLPSQAEAEAAASLANVQLSTSIELTLVLTDPTYQCPVPATTDPTIQYVEAPYPSPPPSPPSPPFPPPFPPPSPPPPSPPPAPPPSPPPPSPPP
eukprot:6514972-Prymnesium_polylepis.1